MADRGRTAIQSARDHEISWPIAHAAFLAHTKTALPAVTPPVERLGIDETRRGKAKFRLATATDGGDVWEVTADRWHVGFVDLGGGAGLLGQVEAAPPRRSATATPPEPPTATATPPTNGSGPAAPPPDAHADNSPPEPAASTGNLGYRTPAVPQSPEQPQKPTSTGLPERS